jgi:hypothetical protein
VALQRTIGNRAVTQMIQSSRSGQRQSVTVQRAAPPTKVSWSEETRTDTNVPPSLIGKVPTSFTLGSEMDADPLSKNSGGLVGSGPKGKSDWWPYLQARHKMGTGLYWVQGHLLNDNLHGPGEPENLTPLSGTSNTNMETSGERAIKDAVLKDGKVVHYKVWAQWRDPAELHGDFGLVADGTGSLVWGEQFAPIGIQWAAWEKQETPPGSGNWVDGPAISPPAPSWYNTFPQPKPSATPAAPPKGFSVQVSAAPAVTGCTVVIKGTGFTDNGHVSISYFGIPRTGEVVGSRGPEPASGVPKVSGGAFTYQENFPFTSTDPSHKPLYVQVHVKDDATSHAELKMVSAGLWVK